MSALVTDAVEEAVDELVPLVGAKAACAAVGLPRASYYRARPAAQEQAACEPSEPPPPSSSLSSPAPQRRPQQQPRALTDDERAKVLEVLHSERFADAAPATVYATLLDEGTYLCSEATMYRLLRERGETGDRRRHATHPAKVKPELVASAPNTVWSWDITKLHGPAKWTYYYLYVILDIFSRYPVGWMVASRESAVLAERLIAESIRKQNVDRGQLTLHADRGSSMASKPVAFLLADLGVTKSHSRPHVSNDNPFSEAQFKTLKYRPDFPEGVAAAHGAPDALFNVAGLIHAGRLTDSDFCDIRRVIEVDLLGTIACCQAFLPALESNARARIVNVSSAFGLVGVGGYSAYNAAKFAVRGFTEALQQEVPPRVTVSCAFPGGVRTDIMRNGLYAKTADADGIQRRFDDRIARTSPEDTAAAILRGSARGRRRIIVGADARAADALARLTGASYQVLTKRLGAGRA